MKPGIDEWILIDSTIASTRPYDPDMSGTNAIYLNDSEGIIICLHRDSIQDDRNHQYRKTSKANPPLTSPSFLPFLPYRILIHYKLPTPHPELPLLPLLGIFSASLKFLLPTNSHHRT